MGVLRLYLALCVVFAHAGGHPLWKVHNGPQAVQIFFLISGFYMAMVLSSPRYQSLRAFYTSRFLRVFPPFWITCVATILLCVCTGLIFGQWMILKPYVTDPFTNNGVLGVVLAGLSNVTLIGQDATLFFSQQGGGALHFNSDFWNDQHPLWRYLIVPQCWSVSLELMFYALAPFLNRFRTPALIGLALVASAARILSFQHFGIAHDPWTYRFFPFEIAVFLFGMLAYRLYAHLKSSLPQGYRITKIPAYFGGVIVLLVLFSLAANGSFTLSKITGPELAGFYTYPLIALALPFLFFLFGNSHLDRFIGELSYPVYLVHYIIIQCFRQVLPRDQMEHLAVLSMLSSVAIAVIFYRFYIEPLDHKRHLLTTGKDVTVVEQ